MKIGLDWGGTKLEAIALDPATNEELRTPYRVIPMKMLPGSILALKTVKTKR